MEMTIITGRKRVPVITQLQLESWIQHKLKHNLHVIIWGFHQDLGEKYYPIWDRITHGWKTHFIAQVDPNVPRNAVWFCNNCICFATVHSPNQRIFRTTFYNKWMNGYKQYTKYLSAFNDKRPIVLYLLSWKYNANAFLTNQATCEIFCMVCCRAVVLKRGAVNHKGV